jgi:hypothetical protein
LKGTPERCEGTSRQETGAIKDTSLQKIREEIKKRYLEYIHRMIVILILRYGESIYGTTTKPALKILEPIHNKGVKLNFAMLAEMRELNTTIVATGILMNEGTRSDVSSPTAEYKMNTQ